MTIEQTEAKIRQTVLNDFMEQTDKKKTDRTIAELISAAVKKMKIRPLKRAVLQSLESFYKRYYKTLQQTLNTKMKQVSVMYYLLDKNDRRRKALDNTFEELGYDNSRMLGVPNMMYSKDYTKNLVKPLIDKLSNEVALDPDDLEGRNSLRNRAEMEVRYKKHEDNIQELKDKGVKLVVASSHADCSERCSEWQGRVYSLDGTRGTTDDGRKYVPLEVATDIYYTTKKGKRYKNGLLGFNCRHYLMAYESGKSPTHPSPQKQAIERALTEKSRAYERAIRKTQIKVMTAKGLDKAEYKKQKAIANSLVEKYKKFCLDNQRPIETERLKII